MAILRYPVKSSIRFDSIPRQAITDGNQPDTFVHEGGTHVDFPQREIATNRKCQGSNRPRRRRPMALLEIDNCGFAMNPSIVHKFPLRIARAFDTQSACAGFDARARDPF